MSDALCGASKNYNRKVCMINGFCYDRRGTYSHCINYFDGCGGEGSGSFYCGEHERWVKKGKCPVNSRAGETSFCTTLVDYTNMRDTGEWCSDNKNEADCNTAYITYDSGPRDSDGRPRTSFQLCSWNTEQKKCKPYVEYSDGVKYNLVTFCPDFCKALGTTATVDLGATRCNQGSQEDTSTYGQPQRLEKEDICEATYFQSSANVFQGCEWLAGTARCSDEFNCPNGRDGCFPACNCQSMLAAPCGPAEINCCDEEKCELCLNIGIEVDISIFKPVVAATP